MSETERMSQMAQNNEPTEEQFRETIRDARRRGVSDQEMADQLGVTEPTIGRWETGAQNAPPNGKVRKVYVEEIEKIKKTPGGTLD